MTLVSPENIINNNTLLSTKEKKGLQSVVKNNPKEIHKKALEGLENNYNIQELINKVDGKKMNREQVAMVQLYANLLGNKIAIDGIYGPQTEAAIALLKKQHTKVFIELDRGLTTFSQQANIFPYPFTDTKQSSPEQQSNQTIEGIDVYIYQKIKQELLQAKSPITAEMVIRSAKKYSVPIHYLMAFMKNDSSYGTMGKGARTKNPGNVGNDDAGGTVKLSTWDEGVDLCAKHLKKVIDAYKKVVGNGFPTPWEIATGRTRQNVKFHGVYMTASTGPRAVTSIANGLVKKGIFIA